MKKKEQGILTIEASIVLTLCVMFMLFLFSFARVYNAQSLVSHALIQSSDSVALESYLRERTLTGSETDVIELANRFMGTTSIKAGSYTSLRSADVYQIAKEKFVYAVGKSESEADAKLKNLGVKDGLSGIDFSASHVDLGNDDVVVYVTYNIEMQFPVFGKDEITVTKAAKSKTFGDILFAIETIPQDPIMGEAFGGGNYKFGTQIEISAVPKYGYKFTKWSDGNVDNPRTVTVVGAKTYVAVFEQSEFGVNLVSSPSTGGSTTGDGVFKYLDSATISATPATGYHFSEWSIYGHSDKKTKKVYEQTTSLQVDQSYTCTAKFDKNLYTVKVLTEGIDSGSASIIYDNTLHYEITAPYSSSFVLSAPMIGTQEFLGWKEEGTDSFFNTSLNIPMNIPAKDVTYVAVYEVKPDIAISGGDIYVKTTQLTATTVPANKTVFWKSSDPSILSIDSDGNITANKSGNVIVTASMVHNGKTYSAIKNIEVKLTMVELESYAYRKPGPQYTRHYYKEPVSNFVSKGYQQSYGQHHHIISITEGEYEQAKTRPIKPGRWADCPVEIVGSVKQSGYNKSSCDGYVLYNGDREGRHYLFFYKQTVGPGGYYISYIK